MRSILIKLQCKYEFSLQEKPGYNRIKAAHSMEGVGKTIELQCKNEFGLQDKPGYNRIEAANSREGARKTRKNLGEILLHYGAAHAININ